MIDRSFNLLVGHRHKNRASTFFHNRVTHNQINNKSLQLAKKWAKVSRLKSKSKKAWHPKSLHLRQLIANTQHRPIIVCHRLKRLHQGLCSSYPSAGIKTSSCVGWTYVSAQNSPVARCNFAIRWTHPPVERKASGSNSIAVALSQLEPLITRIMEGSDPSLKWPTQPCAPVRRTQAITSIWSRTAPIASVIRAQPSAETISPPRPTSRKMKTSTCFRLGHRLLKRGLSSCNTHRIR